MSQPQNKSRHRRKKIHGLGAIWGTSYLIGPNVTAENLETSGLPGRLGAGRVWGHNRQFKTEISEVSSEFMRHGQKTWHRVDAEKEG